MKGKSIYEMDAEVYETSVQIFEKTPEESVESLDPSFRKAIKKVILREQTNINIQKMKGQWKGFYRIREGDLRLIIRFEVDKRAVLIYRIGWRGDVYK